MKGMVAPPSSSSRVAFTCFSAILSASERRRGNNSCIMIFNFMLSCLFKKPPKIQILFHLPTPFAFFFLCIFLVLSSCFVRIYDSGTPVCIIRTWYESDTTVVGRWSVLGKTYFVKYFNDLLVRQFFSTIILLILNFCLTFAPL